MKNRYRIGYYYERKTKEILEKEGWTVWRTPGSHSPVDIIAIKDDNGIARIKLIQVKKGNNIKDLSDINDFEIYKLKKFIEKYNNTENVDIELWIYDGEGLKKYELKNLLTNKS